MPEDDAMSLESERLSECDIASQHSLVCDEPFYTWEFGSISESDGEDVLHVFLPPIDPACFTGEKTAELEQVRAHQRILQCIQTQSIHTR